MTDVLTEKPTMVPDRGAGGFLAAAPDPYRHDGNHDLDPHDVNGARRVSRTPIGGAITPRDAVLAVVVALPPAVWGLLHRARRVMRAFSCRL